MISWFRSLKWQKVNTEKANCGAGRRRDADQEIKWACSASRAEPELAQGRPRGGETGAWQPLSRSAELGLSTADMWQKTFFSGTFLQRLGPYQLTIPFFSSNEHLAMFPALHITLSLFGDVQLNSVANHQSLWRNLSPFRLCHALRRGNVQVISAAWQRTQMKCCRTHSLQLLLQLALCCTLSSLTNPRVFYK